MFEKSLQDLVKGIRSNKRDPSAFISQSIQEIKQELRNVDPFVKAQARRREGGREGGRGRKEIHTFYHSFTHHSPPLSIPPSSSLHRRSASSPTSK
jgi:hypothetical protein